MGLLEFVDSLASRAAVATRA